MKKKERFSRIITLIFFLFFFGWILIQFISPMIISHNSINDLSGLTGVYDNKKIIDQLPFPINKIYFIGDIFCHQKNDRSIYLNDNQMPFCSRCTVIWFGIVLGLGFMIFYNITLDNKFLLITILCFLPLSIDGIGQLFNFWESTNLIRVLTGLLTGLISGMIIGIIIDEIINFKR